MAKVLVEIPRVGLVMEAARVVRWLKAVGDEVVQGEALIEIETEKSMIEIEAAVSGRLTKILVETDAEVAVGTPIAWIDDGAPEQEGSTAIPSQPVAAPEDLEPALPPLKISAAMPAIAGSPDRVLASPAARRRAQELGVDLGHVTATGPGGRIQLEDVERAAAGAKSKQAPDARSSGGAGVALSGMRRMVARTMTLSNATVPQFTVSRAVDWTEVQALRTKASATLKPLGLSLSANDFLVQAVARALLEFPALNSIFVGDPNASDAHIQPATGTHIGLVVAVGDGMVVPVFHDVHKLTLKELAQRRSELVARARAGHLHQDEAGGGTFTISNLGAQGPDQFIAIINPPEAGILAIGRMRDVPVALNGSVVIRPISQLSLTMDHRLADGKMAAEFLGRIVEQLEAGDWPAT